MLDPLGISLSGLGVKPETDQETEHDLVPAATLLRKRTAYAGQKNRAILGSGDKTFTGKPGKRLRHGRCPHAQPCSNIDRPGLTMFVNQIRDQLNIVFSQLVAPRLPYSLESLGSGICRALICHRG